MLGFDSASAQAAFDSGFKDRRSVTGSAEDIWSAIGKQALDNIPDETPQPRAAKVTSSTSKSRSNTEILGSDSTLRTGTIGGSVQLSRPTPTRPIASVSYDEIVARWVSRVSTYAPSK